MARPLTGWSKFLLICGASGAVFLFYCFASASVLLLLAAIAFELVLAVAAARVALAPWVARIMHRHLALLKIFVKSFRVRKGVEFRIPLQAADAPGLFATLDSLCRRLDVAPPQTVSLEMTCSAWVRLKGLRRGGGKTILGVGYDLLAGLSVTEAEAVLAHEMVHAKLIQRGFRSWLMGGLNRAGNLSRSLAAQVGAFRAAKISSELAGTLLAGADRLTRLGARLVAAYSRQDEFEADRGAAELCGVGPIRSSLSKLEAIARITARLPWRERVARLQAGNGFSQWLLAELAAGTAFQPAENRPDLFNKYSTHPSLNDRLAALASVPDRPTKDTGPAIRLLADPDAIAATLVLEIQRVAAEQEKLDSRQLQRWVRKARNNAHLRGAQAIGVALIVAGILTGFFVWLDSGLSLNLTLGVAGCLAAGFACYRLSRYKDKVPLPVPDFALLKETSKGGKKTKDLAGAQKEIESELATLVARETKSKKPAFLAAQSYQALARCDYLRAHVAARLCLKMNSKSVEGFLGLMIASSALRNHQQFVSSFGAVRKATGIRTDSTIWGVAWALVLARDWGQAEAYLERALEARPEETTFRALLAVCQARRGKLQSAIMNARQLCIPVAKNKEYAKLLIELQLDGGYLREAQQRLTGLESQAPGDSELMLALARVSLMLGEVEKARKWVAMLEMDSQSALTLVQLGGMYESARKDDDAAEFYHKALTAGFYPEACLGLARLEMLRQDKEKARGLLLQALDLVRPVGEGSAGPIPHFHQVTRQLLALEEPILNCRAWVARFGTGNVPKALASQSFLIYAPSQADAGKFVLTILGALHPGTPPVLTSAISWRLAPAHQQPDGPARPGIQAVFQN
jgi:tetratricopeptide (TPR) repeat protein